MSVTRDWCALQEYSSNLGSVVDIVVSHQSLPLKVALVSQLMIALVLPAPDPYRSLLRRFVALGKHEHPVTSSAKDSFECRPGRLSKPSLILL